MLNNEHFNGRSLLLPTMGLSEKVSGEGREATLTNYSHRSKSRWSSFTKLGGMTNYHACSFQYEKGGQLRDLLN